MNSKIPGDGSYAGLYLYRCNKESKSDDEMDIQVLTRLTELDSKLGLTASKQLFYIVSQTTRWNIIKVIMND